MIFFTKNPRSCTRCSPGFFNFTCTDHWTVISVSCLVGKHLNWLQFVLRIPSKAFLPILCLATLVRQEGLNYPLKQEWNPDWSRPGNGTQVEWEQDGNQQQANALKCFCFCNKSPPLPLFSNDHKQKTIYRYIHIKSLSATDPNGGKSEDELQKYIWVAKIHLSCKQILSKPPLWSIPGKLSDRHDMKLEWKLKEKETDEELQLEKLRIISFCFASQHLQPMGKGRVKEIL